MKQQEVTELVLSVLRPFARNQENFAAATLDSRLWEDLQINSARFIDVLLAFEEQLDMEIDDTQVENVASVGDIVKLVVAFAEKNPETAKRVEERIEAKGS